jgi:predicted aconitase with swiveling domain
VEGYGVIRARVLNRGTATGPVLALSEPLSFWGGFDPRTGAIIDIHHPQCGACLAGRIALMAETRGSGTAPGAIAEAIRLGTAPAAIITITPDVNIAIGASVADALYGRTFPVLAVEPEDFEFLSKAASLTIFANGTITAASP